MSNATTWHLLRRHFVAFAISFLSLTTLMVFDYMRKHLGELTASGASAGTIAEVGLLSLPFVAATTLPMAVLSAVLWVFTRLGAVGALAAARQEPHGVRRLLAPVLGVGVVVAALTLVLTTQILPRTNERLAVIRWGATEVNDRSMTIRELRAAARTAREDAGPDALVRAASFEVEIHKKYALAASCVVLGLTAAAIVFLLPRGGLVLLIGTTPLVFAFYYVGLIAGESLAERLIVSPFVAMWAANAFFLAFALVAMWGARWSQAPVGIESQPIDLSSPVSSGGPTPISLRIAASLFALIGLFKVGAAVVLTAQSILSAWLDRIALGVAGIAGFLMCISAFWVWQRRRRGLVMAVVAWLLPVVLGLIAYAKMSLPSIVATIALIILSSNRHQLR